MKKSRTDTKPKIAPDSGKRLHDSRPCSQYARSRLPPLRCVKVTSLAKAHRPLMNLWRNQILPVHPSRVLSHLAMSHLTPIPSPSPASEGREKGLLLKSLPAGGEGYRVGLQAFSNGLLSLAAHASPPLQPS